jgi:L-ribulose-5-phosphate 3-epimerase UlaE
MFAQLGKQKHAGELAFGFAIDVRNGEMHVRFVIRLQSFSRHASNIHNILRVDEISKWDQRHMATISQLLASCCSILSPWFFRFGNIG